MAAIRNSDFALRNLRIYCFNFLAGLRVFLYLAIDRYLSRRLKLSTLVWSFVA
jgi:hypothetical protein